MHELEAIEAAAVQAVEAGGTYLREQFAAGNVAGEYTATDVKADADRGAESRMLAVIEQRFPEHAIYAEESGTRPGRDYRWIVDPLDGTNNFTAGLPSFGSAVAVLDERADAGESAATPVVAAVSVPVLEDLYVARRDAGVRYNGTQVTAENDREMASGTVAFVIGHDVAVDPDRLAVARDLRAAIEDVCKRVLPSWSPTVHWGLFARGQLDGMVTFHPDREEQYAGELLAVEAGAVASSESEPESYVGAVDESGLATLVDAIDAVR